MSRHEVTGGFELTLPDAPLIDPNAAPVHAPADKAQNKQQDAQQPAQATQAQTMPRGSNNNQQPRQVATAQKNSNFEQAPQGNATMMNQQAKTAHGQHVQNARNQNMMARSANGNQQQASHTQKAQTVHNQNMMAYGTAGNQQQTAQNQHGQTVHKQNMSAHGATGNQQQQTAHNSHAQAAQNQNMMAFGAAGNHYQQQPQAMTGANDFDFGFDFTADDDDANNQLAIEATQGQNMIAHSSANDQQYHQAVMSSESNFNMGNTVDNVFGHQQYQGTTTPSGSNTMQQSFHGATPSNMNRQQMNNPTMPFRQIPSQQMPQTPTGGTNPVDLFAQMQTQVQSQVQAMVQKQMSQMLQTMQQNPQVQSVPGTVSFPSK
jgi:hypothetical protein